MLLPGQIGGYAGEKAEQRGLEAKQQGRKRGPQPRKMCQQATDAVYTAVHTQQATPPLNLAPTSPAHHTHTHRRGDSLH